MNRPRATSIRTWILGGSVVLHAGLGLAAVLIPKPERAETAAIELADIKKKKEPPKPPPPPPPPPVDDKPKPPPPPPKAQAQAKIAPDTAKAEAPPPVPMGADGFADLGGMALGNGGGGDGVPIGAPAGPGANAGPTPAPTAKAVTHKAAQQLAPSAAETCNDPPVRPKRKVPVAPKYTMQARQAEIEGVVRVEVTVDENGHVIAARVVSGLGYGLDESALDAAKASTFEPASRCGKAIVGTVVLPFRFEST